MIGGGGLPRPQGLHCIASLHIIHAHFSLFYINTQIATIQLFIITIKSHYRLLKRGAPFSWEFRSTFKDHNSRTILLMGAIQTSLWASIYLKSNLRAFNLLDHFTHFLVIRYIFHINCHICLIFIDGLSHFYGSIGIFLQICWYRFWLIY